DTTHPVSPTVAGYPVSRATPSSSLRFFQISILPDGSLHLHDPANVRADQSQWRSFQTSDALCLLWPLEGIRNLCRVVADMNIGRIRQRLSGGFRPFAIRTSDGQEYTVLHPEVILLGRHTFAV